MIEGAVTCEFVTRLVRLQLQWCRFELTLDSILGNQVPIALCLCLADIDCHGIPSDEQEQLSSWRHHAPILFRAGTVLLVRNPQKVDEQCNPSDP